MLTLTAGSATLTIAPEIGGAIAGWQRAGQPIMRPTPPEALTPGNARALASYPLVPFSNRIANRRFTWMGTTYNLPEQFGGFAIHGVGWLREWQVAEATTTTATITLDHTPSPEWPFPFRTWQHFSLTADGLTHSIGITNTGPTPFPAGFGQHPFFPRGPRTRIAFTTTEIWHNGAPGQIPSHATPVEGVYDHSAGQAVGPVFIDNCFSGFTGHARIDNPDFGHSLEITSDPIFGHCILYTPPGVPHFAFEPVSHMNDAINRMDSQPGHGLFILAPGESRDGSITYRVETQA